MVEENVPIEIVKETSEGTIQKILKKSREETK